MRQETDKAERPGRRRSRLKALLSLVLAFGGVALLWAFHCVDSAPPEDADLRLPVEVVPDGENGFELLGQAAAGIEWPDDVMVEGDEDDESFSLGDKLEECAYGRQWDQKLVSDTLASNARQLDLLDRAIDRESFVSAPVTEAEQPVLDGWENLRRAYILASLRVGERQGAGDDRAALGEAFKLVKLGRRLEEAGGPIIRYVYALGVSGMARDRLLRLVAEAHLYVADWKGAVRELERQQPRRDVLRQTFLAEYAYDCLLIDAAAEGKIPLDPGDLSRFAASPQPIGPWGSRRFLLPNHSKRLLGSLCREVLGAEPSGPFLAIPWDDFLALAPNRWLPGRNGIGRHAVSSCVAGYREMVERHRRSHLGRELLRLAVALKGFHTARARLPDELEELAPEWIPAVPKDPFDGQPLRYDRSRRLLWSIGQDRKDVGGILEPDPEDPELDLDEPTLKLPFS